MKEKLATLGPEMVMVAGAFVCLFMGLWRTAAVRRATVWMAAATLAMAGLVVMWDYAAGAGVVGGGILGLYIKAMVVAMGMLLLMLVAQVPEHLKQAENAETAAETGKGFEPGDVVRGEFFSFFLLSLSGVMLCAEAGDLVWLFLALELTSLPTYVMVAIGRDRVTAQESAVKYFFLGALAAALFLYGFTLIYGATGLTEFGAIQAYVTDNGTTPLFITGVVVAIVGIAFKIAAVPMHFYAADVYEGAAVPITAFLAFVPKTAGFVSIILLLGLVGDPLPDQVTWLIWLMAAATMTVGNVLGLMQNNVKRMLAYGSIAQSGYMLVALVGGTTLQESDSLPNSALGNGVAAVLFYLVAYGLGSLGAFAVLACLRARGEEADMLDDLAGLSKRHGGMSGIMLLSVLSLVGLPPLVGFIGKIYLFGAAIHHGFVGLVIIAVLNTAISAVYYLRIISVCYFSEPSEQTQMSASLSRRVSAMAATTAALLLGIGGNWLVKATNRAATTPAVVHDAQIAPHNDGFVETVDASDISHKQRDDH